MTTDDPTLLAARAGDADAFSALVSPHRRELRAHCYRMSGSLEDADDLLQESLVRAWRGLRSFEGRSSLRTWLYKVTTNTCIDAMERRSARVLPPDLGPPVDASKMGPPRLDVAWIEPCPDELWVDLRPSPEAVVSGRESVALAFLVALQALPPKQRAVLILRDVVGLEATECATELDLTVAAVSSALQRARDTLGRRMQRAEPVDESPPPELLARYVQAWHRADVEELVSLLREDATLAMPPLPMWLRGVADIRASIAAMVFVPGASGRFRLEPIRANGRPAFAVWTVDPVTGDERPYGIHVLDIAGGRIAGIVAFLDGRLLARFGLPHSGTGASA